MAASSSNPPPPEARAAEIVEKLLSHPSLITKTGTAILGSGLLATAISQELCIQRGDRHRSWVHDPLCLCCQGSSVSFLFSTAPHSPTLPSICPSEWEGNLSTITPLFPAPYFGRSFCGLRGETESILIETCPRADRSPKEWAENHIARIEGVFDRARAEHTQAVKDRIDEVGQMKDVISLTEGLFAISKVSISRARVPPPHDSSITPFIITGYCEA
jgi:hypothetical protein